MPIYEYKCTSCEGHFEYLQRISEEPKSACEACGSALERLVSLTSFQLKGSGWYRDLYSSPKPDAGGDGASNGAAASGDQAGSSGGEGSSSGAGKEAPASSSSEKGGSGGAKTPAS